MPIHVNVDNFARAETDRMFASLQADAGGVNRLKHNREPTPIDHQPVIRMNRDTLYSVALVDVSDGATVTVPDAGDRYVSVMVVNEDHFDHAVGAKGDVDPVRHLLGSAAGWGGLPDREASYIGVEPRLPVGEYKLTVRDVPVDGFWSISVYNAGATSSRTAAAPTASPT